MNVLHKLLLFVLVMPFKLCHARKAAVPVFRNKEFVMYSDSIVQQNRFIAKALSSTALQSNYYRPFNEFLAPGIVFKFSVNGQDNEMKPGSYHRFNCMADSGGNCTTPLIRFGQPFTVSIRVPYF